MLRERGERRSADERKWNVLGETTLHYPLPSDELVGRNDTYFRFPIGRASAGVSVTAGKASVWRR